MFGDPNISGDKIHKPNSKVLRTWVREHSTCTGVVASPVDLLMILQILVGLKPALGSVEASGQSAASPEEVFGAFSSQPSRAGLEFLCFFMISSIM